MHRLRLQLFVLAVAGSLASSGGCSQAKSVPRTAEEAFAACSSAYTDSVLRSFNWEGLSSAGPPKRLAAHFACLRKPAEMGHSYSQFRYGFMLENG